MKIQSYLIVFFAAISLLISTTLAGEPVGNIQGKLTDAQTGQPLIGANISVQNTVLGAATDMDGFFIISDLPVGNYVLKFEYIGYQTKVQTDVIVRPQRFTRVDAALKLDALQSEEVLVTAGYFNEKEETPVSVTTFSYEEIRRAPGSAGDVSRIIMSLPSVAKVNDQSNSLIVRGGSPMENGFLVDNMEIPNINHYPLQGSSGGPIGLLNVDLIKDVNFYTGGFQPQYGDRLSAFMDIKFREGNREEFDGQLDLNFTGFGGVVEGPLAGKKGSYLLSLRRSYLDLLVDMVDLGTSISPRYGDAQAKVVYDLSKNHQLNFLFVGGDDHSESDNEAAEENKMLYFGRQDYSEYSSGINWRALWTKKAISNTSISYSRMKFDEDYFRAGPGILALDNRSLEDGFHFRNVNTVRISGQHSVNFGIEAKFLNSDYQRFYGKSLDALGNEKPEVCINAEDSHQKYAFFNNYTLRLRGQWTCNLGVRADYFSLTEKMNFSPRISLNKKVNARLSLNAAYGIFNQNLPLSLLALNPEAKNLNDPRAAHYVFGINYLLTPSTQVSMEIFQKDYRNFPIDPTQSRLFMIDEIFYRSAFYFSHEKLIDAGKAQTRGIEFLIQKKLAEKLYGMSSLSVFKSRYQSTDGNWRDRVFDNRVIFSMEGGYKPNAKWEMSFRWIYAGGVPFTPFDHARSQALNQGVLDDNRINEARYPDYHSLNIRFDRRFHFHGSNLVFYLSAWNAYNQENVATYFWNEYENKQDKVSQWNLLPIFGLEYEF